MKQLLEKLTTLAAYTAAVCTIVILLVTSININCFDKDFYKTEYASLETAQSLGMTEKDLNKATDALLDYLQDRRDNINVTVAVKGTETKAFNARESSHMVDVRTLYHFAMVLRCSYNPASGFSGLYGGAFKGRHADDFQHQLHENRNPGSRILFDAGRLGLC